MSHPSTASELSGVTDRGWFGGLARLLPLTPRQDARGELIPLDFDRLPFAPCRAFVIRDVPDGLQRGRHAHRDGQQLLVCVNGQIDVELRHGDASVEVELRAGGDALLLDAGVWAAQTYHGRDAILLVLASHPYDPDGYLNSDHG